MKRSRRLLTGNHGYRFKALTGQDPVASGGACSYLIGKGMVTGCALVAWPVCCGSTGVKNFSVNQNGPVLQRGLGPNTASVAGAIHRVDPLPGWHPVLQPPELSSSTINVTRQARRHPGPGSCGPCSFKRRFR